jgi:hypothetical protein
MKNFDAFKEHGDVIWNIANLLRGPYRLRSAGQQKLLLPWDPSSELL